jgi:Primase C terminal 1 (PriCT-1)
MVVETAQWGDAARQALVLGERFGFVAVPLEVTRHEGGRKDVQPFAKYAHLAGRRFSVELFEELWGSRPDAPGLGLWDPSLVEIEADGPEGEARLFSLKLPRTPTFRSTRGPKYLFHATNGDEVISAAVLGPQIEVLQGSRKLLIVPPTPGYSWLPSLSLDDVPLAPLPDWIAAAGTSHHHGAADPIGENIPQGERRSSLLSLAGAMRRRGAGEVEIRAALTAMNLGRCRPPLPAEEVEELVKDVPRRYSPATPSSNGQGHTELAHTPVSQPPPIDLDGVLAVFDRWLYLESPDPVLVVLGAVAANLRPGDPFWLELIASPGGGKTELLASLSYLPGVRFAATITEASLLSGTPRKDKAADSKGGLLREIGDHGLLVLKDFGSVLSMHREARAAVLAALREVYDGSWTRYVGTDGGRSLAWWGKVGLIAAVTPVVDRHHAVMAALGERFTSYRLPPIDEERAARAALAHAGREAAMRAELATAVASFFRGLDLQSEPEARTEEEERLLVGMATLATRARSSVERDGYSRDIELVPAPEAPARLASGLDRLRAGLRCIGLGRSDAWRIVAKAAIDCVPEPRRTVLDLMVDGRTRTTTEVADAVSLPTQTSRRTLEDLAAHRLLNRQGGGQGKADLWQARTWTTERYVMAVPEMSGAENGLTTSLLVNDDISGKVVAT